MNIYFSGIGGVGIGPLAMIARDAGYDISGSDISESLTTQELVNSGISVSYDQSGENLVTKHSQQPIDWFVHTAALPDTHPELLAARKLGIKTAKRDELLAHIIAEHNLKLIAVAGTHGKTTATGMLVWTLQQLGINVSYSLGSTISFGPSGKFVPGAEYFVYECDEFDRNFLHFKPYLSLITSVDYDHPDTYPTELKYTAAFRQFIDQSDHTILWQRDANYIEAPASENIWCLQPNEEQPLNIAGVHNRQNATIVLKGVEYLATQNPAAFSFTEDSAFPAGVSQDTQQLAANGSKEKGKERSGEHKKTVLIEHFPGTNRRFEKLADNLYSDYGHHPVEIAATLQMADELSDTVVLVYQPHQNIRQHELLGQYINQFERASRTYWLPTYLSREDPNLPIVSFDELTSTISNRETIVQAEMDNNLWQKITAARNDGALVLGMGAGSIDAWLRERLEKS